MKQFHFTSFAILLIFVVQGCGPAVNPKYRYPARTPASYPQHQPPTRHPAQKQYAPADIQEPRQEPAAAPLPQSDVSIKFSNQADQLSRNGQLDAAAQTLERGLRITPKDPYLWSKLAAVRLQQHRYGQAQSLAAKSNSLARGDRSIMQKNQAIIDAAGQ